MLDLDNKDINRIINKYCPFVDIEDIKDIIVGCVDRNKSISAMVQLIHSEVDADGIDYVMRDATFSGTSYGGFELGLLLRNLVVSEYEGVEIVGIKPKGISVVDQYLVSKYFAYTQVIFNRHVAIYDTMAEIFSKALIKLGSNYPSSALLKSYIKNHNTNDRYLKFTDRAFWSQLDMLEEKDVNLDGFISKYIVKMHGKLQHYQEFDMDKNKEFIITSNDPTKVYNSIISEQIYRDLSGNDEDKIIMYHKKGFTNEIPEDEFRRRINEINNSVLPEDEFIIQNTKRLQEGIAVIENDGNMKLLADDHRSIMSHLYSTKTYILREYIVD